MKAKLTQLFLTGLLTGAWVLTTSTARAHCDTMDGPVVTDAKSALAKNDVTSILKWIKSEHEAELKAAFARTLTVRTKGAEARELADHYFFETLLRLHREGEGAPYTGLKPAGTKLDPAVEAADKALEGGNADALIKSVADETAAGIRKRFMEAVEKKRHAEHNVEAGREYVAAYVEFVHYVETLHTTAAREAQAHEHADTAAQPAKPAHAHGN